MEYVLEEKNDLFEDDTYVKSSSHFVHSKEFFELLNYLLESASSKDPDGEAILSKHTVEDLYLAKSIALVNFRLSFFEANCIF